MQSGSMTNGGAFKIGRVREMKVKFKMGIDSKVSLVAEFDSEVNLSIRPPGIPSNGLRSINSQLFFGIVPNL